jgi:hypothetical protein
MQGKHDRDYRVIFLTGISPLFSKWVHKFGSIKIQSVSFAEKRVETDYPFHQNYIAKTLSILFLQQYR